MKIAVVTPYFKESEDLIQRCFNSVKNQTYQNITHFFVSDGYPSRLLYANLNIEHIQLPKSHNDAGATPRALGALSAFSQGYDAVAFLDVDNWFMPNHIEKMVELMQSSKCDIVSATRKIYSRNNELLYVDKESNGLDFCDTNCMFLNRKIMQIIPFWITAPEYRMVSDRAFWHVCIENKISKIHCTEPTVCYSTKWAVHYQIAGVPIPDDSVWMTMDNKTYTTITNKERNK